MQVTARFKLGDREFTAVVINPGGWFGKCKLVGVGGCFWPAYFVVEAGNEGDAIDELAESEKWGHLIRVDIEREGADYGYEVNPGDLICSVEVEQKGWVNLLGEFTADPAKGRYLNEPNVTGNGTYYCSDHIELPQGWTDLVYIVELDELGIKGTVEVKPCDWDDFIAAIDATTVDQTRPTCLKGTLVFGE